MVACTVKSKRWWPLNEILHFIGLWLAFASTFKCDAASQALRTYARYLTQKTIQPGLIRSLAWLPWRSQMSFHVNEGFCYVRGTTSASIFSEPQPVYYSNSKDNRDDPTADSLSTEQNGSFMVTRARRNHSIKLDLHLVQSEWLAYKPQLKQCTQNLTPLSTISHEFLHLADILESLALMQCSTGKYVLGA